MIIDNKLYLNNKIEYRPVKTYQIIKDVLNRSKLDLRVNVSFMNLYTFIKFTKLRVD